MNKIKFQISRLDSPIILRAKINMTRFNSVALVTTSLCYFCVLVKKINTINLFINFYNKIILNSTNDCYVILYSIVISLKFTICWIHHTTAFCIKGPRIHKADLFQRFGN